MDLHSAPKGSISLSSETGLRSRERLNNQVWRLNNQGSPTWGWAHRQRAGRCVVVCLSAAVGLLGSRDSLDRVTAWMLFTQRERTFTSPGPWPPNALSVCLLSVTLSLSNVGIPMGPMSNV